MFQDQDDLQELLNAVSSKEDAKVVNKDIKSVRAREIQSFIRIKNIEEGPQAVPLEYIYNSYKKWSKNPLAPKAFSSYFKEHFKRRRNGALAVTIFYIDPRGVGLHETYTVYKDPHYYKSKYKEPKIYYLGVYYNANNKITVRVIMPDGFYKIIRGNYQSLKSAAMAYDKYVIEIYGKDAVVNFPKRWNGQVHGIEQTKKDRNKEPKST